MAVLHGSCLCGDIKYEIVGPLRGLLNCHCTMCRKAQGSAFRSRAGIDPSQFKWIQGEELMTYYRSSPDYQRGFCRICGSPIVNRSLGSSAKGYGLALGTLDDDPGLRPQRHVFVAYKAPWFEIADDLPQDPEWPPSL